MLSFYTQFKSYLLMLIVTVIVFWPIGAFGQTLFSMSGLVVFVTPCTCTPPAALVTYVPPHNIQYPWITRSLIVSPTTLLRSYIEHVFSPTSWHVGNFFPVGQCLIGVPPECIPFPADGTFFMVGPSYPGFGL